MCELFASFASIPTPIVLSNLISESLPALSSILLEILIDPFSTRASAALDLIDNVFDGRGVELGEGLFGVVAEGLFGALGGTEDREVLQTGLHIVTTVVRKDVDQLLNWYVHPLSLPSHKLTNGSQDEFIRPNRSLIGPHSRRSSPRSLRLGIRWNLCGRPCDSSVEEGWGSDWRCPAWASGGVRREACQR